MKKTLLLLTIAFTFAFSNVGKITALKGEVYIIRDAQQLSAKTGSILKLKDQIKTQNSARALILFNDNTSITVGNNSTLAVNDFVIDLINPKKSKTNFGFGQGIFRTITGKIGKINPKGFKIETKSASIGIRGTTLDTSVKILADGTENVSVAFIKGYGFITSNINNIEVAVNTGENANMLQNGQHILSKGALKETEKMNQDEKELQSLLSKKQNVSLNTIGLNDVVDDVDSLDIKSALNTIGTNDVVDEINALDNDTKKDNNQNIITNETNEISKDNEIDISLDTITKETMCPTTICNLYSLYISDFGYIKNDLDKIIGTYVKGIQTPSQTIQEYITNNQTGVYSGEVYGTQSVIGSTHEKSITSGTIELNMDFGNSSFDGNMTIYNGNWKVNIDNGTLSTEGFSSANISDAVGTSVTGITGNLDGNFYGSNAQTVAGSFNLKTSTQQVIGVFGAQ